MVRLRGLEPLTYRSGICRSIQLSYRRIRHPYDQIKLGPASRFTTQHMNNEVLSCQHSFYSL